MFVLALQCSGSLVEALYVDKLQPDQAALLYLHSPGRAQCE